VSLGGIIATDRDQVTCHRWPAAPVRRRAARCRSRYRTRKDTVQAAQDFWQL